MGDITARIRAISVICCVGALAVVLGPSVTHAQYVLEDLYNPKRYEPDTLVVPVGYYSTALEFAGGLAGYTNGLFQRQVQEYEFVIGSTDASYGAVVGMSSL